MDDILREKLNELFFLLDELDCIKNIESIKKDIPNDLVLLINEYRLNPTSSNKMKLYNNSVFLKYIENETELNYLIMEINNKFKRKRGHCESN